MSDKKIDISFCLPVYNVAPYIEECIKSIVTQKTEGISYDVVCVDDGSKDDSVEILKRLQQKYDFIKIFFNDGNKGVSYTRNRLIELATGKYIWFIDPDDMLYPNVVANMFNEIEKHNENVILADYVRCNERAVLSAFKENDTYTCSVVKTADRRYEPKEPNGNHMTAVWCGMFKRSFLLENNLKFVVNMIAQEDRLFYYHFDLKTETILRFYSPCYIYRQRSTSAMHTKTDEQLKKYYRSMRLLYNEYLKLYENKEYRDEGRLLAKIHHMQQSCTICLARCLDTKFVKSELKDMKKNKIYPYKFRTDAFNAKDNILIKLFFFLQPIEPFFWMLHCVGKLRNK
ncbi:MAG: glycosyltransferase [Clostridia bacterium]|nr:glycosyltransferase [Clostridia bacterium]